MTREKERALKDLLNLLDDAFDGLDFTEEIRKFEEKYTNKAGFQIGSRNKTILMRWAIESASI